MSNLSAVMPGAREIIEVLRGRGMHLGIVSNAQFYTPLMIEALLGAAPEHLGFEPEISVWSWKENEAKPSPRLFEAALAHLRGREGIPAEQVLYVGNDMRNDIRPSKELGCATALFAGDARSLRLRENDESTRGVEPDAIVTELRHLDGIVTEKVS